MVKISDSLRVCRPMYNEPYLEILQMINGEEVSIMITKKEAEKLEVAIDMLLEDDEGKE